MTPTTTHIRDRPDVDALWQRIRATGLCARTVGRVPIGVFLALHLCDKAIDEGARPPRTVTRRVLGEFDAYHDPRRQGPGGGSPRAPNLMRRMNTLPAAAGDLWRTPSGQYRVDHASASLIPTHAPTHARLVANACGWLRSELARAGIPDAAGIDIRIADRPHGQGAVDGVEMPLDGIVGGSHGQKAAAAETVVAFLTVARSASALAAAAALAEAVRPAMIQRGVPELLAGCRPGAMRASYANEEKDGPVVSWYALDLSGLGEDLLPRRWSIVASPRSEGVGENALDAIRAERRNRKAVATGPRVEHPLLAMLGMEGVRDLYAATSEWQRDGSLTFRGRRTMPTSELPERFPREIDHVAIRAGVLSASIRLDSGVHWAPGRLTVRKVELPPSVLLALPGMPLRTVVEHPWLDPDAVIQRVASKAPREYEFKVEIGLRTIEGGNPARGEE